jgi:hypothetical protein
MRLWIDRDIVAASGGGKTISTCSMFFVERLAEPLVTNIRKHVLTDWRGG